MIRMYTGISKTTPCDAGECPYGAERLHECEAYCGWELVPRFTVAYDGYLFDGDADGLNVHELDSWDEVRGIIDAYGDTVEVTDRELEITWSHGAWS